MHLAWASGDMVPYNPSLKTSNDITGSNWQASTCQWNIWWTFCLYIHCQLSLTVTEIGVDI